MTRINAGIPVTCLCDEHLLAEHREIKRLPNLTLNGNPLTYFTLGKGHVTFFKDKMGYTLNRYREIHQECIARGFNVTNYATAWINKDTGDYTPTQDGITLLQNRIIERLTGMKRIHYYGIQITSDEAIKLLLNSSNS